MGSEQFRLVQTLEELMPRARFIDEDVFYNHASIMAGGQARLT